jgi:hypothetical protein
MTAPKQTVVIMIEGGLVQWVFSDHPGLECIVYDYDVEGASLDELIIIPDSDGDRREAYVRGEDVTVEPEYFAKLKTAIEAGEHPTMPEVAI